MPKLPKYKRPTIVTLGPDADGNICPITHKDCEEYNISPKEFVGLVSSFVMAVKAGIVPESIIRDLFCGDPMDIPIDVNRMVRESEIIAVRVFYKKKLGGDVSSEGAKVIEKAAAQHAVLKVAFQTASALIRQRKALKQETP